MRSTESGFSENVYLVAAQERTTLVNKLLDDNDPDYVTISYLAGVAVECIFHAYRMRLGVEDTARHDLRIHATISGFYNGMIPSERQRMGEYLGQIIIRWQNNHRYRSVAAMRAYIDKHRLFIIEGQKTIRNDGLKYNAEVLVEAADQIITAGIRRWNL